MAHPERMQSAIITVFNWSTPCRSSAGELTLDILSICPPTRVVSCFKGSPPHHCALEMCKTTKNFSHQDSMYTTNNCALLYPGFSVSWVQQHNLSPLPSPRPQISARTHQSLKENIFFFHRVIFHGQILFLFRFLFGIRTELTNSHKDLDILVANPNSRFHGFRPQQQYIMVFTTVCQLTSITFWWTQPTNSEGLQKQGDQDKRHWKLSHLTLTRYGILRAGRSWQHAQRPSPVRASPLAFSLCSGECVISLLWVSECCW